MSVVSCSSVTVYRRSSYEGRGLKFIEHDALDAAGDGRSSYEGRGLKLVYSCRFKRYRRRSSYEGRGLKYDELPHGLRWSLSSLLV